MASYKWPSDNQTLLNLVLQETGGGSDAITIQAPASIAASYTLTLPVDDGTSNQVLSTDGSGVLSWATVGAGDVTGPGSSTDNALVRFDSTTGKLIQNSVGILDDSGNLSGLLQITANSVLVGSSANTISALRTIASDTSLTFQTNGSTTFGSVSTAGLWNLGAASGVQNHIVNGRSITLQQAGTSGSFFSVTNTNNTAVNAFALLQLSVGGSTSTGDPYINFNIAGESDWALGVDNSDSNKFKITSSASLSSGEPFSIDASTNAVTLTGSLLINTAGKGLQIKEGSNATMGVVTLSAGTATVSTTAVTASSRIFLTAQSLGTVTVGQGLAVSARSAGTSFTILSGNVADTSVVAWLIYEPL